MSEALCWRCQQSRHSREIVIGDGAGECSSDAKASFYRIASRSATECAAILDASRRVDILSERHHAEGRALLLRIVSMLTKLAKRHNTL